ncbi:MAG: hypothetical protein HYX89_04210 [Chloroflexi bacterium]|nr:hypothetical protein [Chloroflexota bacterium]
MAKLKVAVQKSDFLTMQLAKKLSPEEEKRFREVTLADQLDIVMAGEPEKLQQEIVDADFLITENQPITAELIARAKQLRLIQNGGLRHNAIDLEAARRAGIPVCVTAMPGDIRVAELALLLMMALSTKLLQADQAVRRGDNPRGLASQPALNWSQYIRTLNWVGLAGLSILHQKTLGIVGLGEIGGHVARLARAFEMRVLYYNSRRHSPEDEQKLEVEYRPLRDLMAEADIVSLHVGQTPATVGLIGAREIAAMKPTAFLINTARGANVDQDALYEALAARRIAGAGLNVFREEPLPTGHPLTQLDNVILTPHIGGGQSVWWTGETIFANIKRALRGEPLQGVINS